MIPDVCSEFTIYSPLMTVTDFILSGILCADLLSGKREGDEEHDE